MEEFVSASQFHSILMLKVVVGLISIYLMHKFAIRNPTNYDTPYRKKMRYIYGWICSVSAIGFVVLICVGPIKSMLPWYYFGTYGTFTPSADAIQYGMSSHMVIRHYGAKCIWGRMTFEQWTLSEYIAGMLAWAALAVYTFTMKRSSVKWFAKLRKAIGYILLLTLPIQVNNLHYFDQYELIPLAVYLLITYLFARTYKFDNKEPKIPEETKYNHIADFVAETPQEIVNIEQDARADSTPHNESVDGESCSENYTEDKNNKEKKFRFKHPLKWIGGIIILLLITIITLTILRSENEPDCSKFLRFGNKIWIQDYDVKEWASILNYDWSGWSLEDNNNDDSTLGLPTAHTLCSKCERIRLLKADKNASYYYGCYKAFSACRISMYNILSLGYGKHDSNKYIHDIALRFASKDAVITQPSFANGKDAIYFQEYLTAREDEEFFLDINLPTFADTKSGETYWFDHYIKDNYIFCVDGTAYHFEFYHLKDVRSPVIVIENVYFRDPILPWNNSIIICGVLLCIFLLLFIICFVRKFRKEFVANKYAYFLQWYILCMLAVQVIWILILPIIAIGAEEFDEFYYISMIFVTAGLIFINIPALFYVSRKVDQEYTIDYLVPNWFKNKFIVSSQNQSVNAKSSLVLLFYPLFYVATLPYGAFVLGYIIPMSVIFALVYLARWMFREDKQHTQPITPKVNKQAEFTGNTFKEKLQLLKSMLDEGLITQEDYDKKKEDILRNIG